MRSADSTRTKTGTSCAAPAKSWPTSASSPPAPCSRSTSNQSKPLNAQTSATSGEPRLRNVPMCTSPLRMTCLNDVTTAPRTFDASFEQNMSCVSLPPRMRGRNFSRTMEDYDEVTDHQHPTHHEHSHHARRLP